MIKRQELQQTNRIVGSTRWIALTAVLITMFFSAMDQTVVATAMPVIVGDLKGLNYYAWVYTAYAMASAVTVPIYGKLSDVYGRKPFYIIGLFLFMVGSAVSGQAHSMLELIAARGFQGIGAGAMLSMPRATIGDIFTPRERGKWMGLITGVFGLASIIGPFLGGWITTSFGWRWVFYINLPFAALALLLVWISLPWVRSDLQASPDVVGSVALVAGLTPILLGFTWGGSQYDWGSWQEILLFASGGLILCGFALWEYKAENPIIMLSLFSNPTFLSTVIVGLLVSMGLFGSLMFLPLFVQGVIGLTALGSGVVVTPMMGAFVVASLISGLIITRTGKYKLLAHIAALVMALGMFLLTLFQPTTGYGEVVRDMIVLGLGVGALMPLLNVVAQNIFPYKIMGMVNSTQQFVISLGGVIAIPILGSVVADTFQNELSQNLPAVLRIALERIPPSARTSIVDPEGLTTAATQNSIKPMFYVFGHQAQFIYHEFINALHIALTTAIVDVFRIGLAFALAAFLGTFLLREIRLKKEEYFEQE